MNNKLLALAIGVLGAIDVSSSIGLSEVSSSNYNNEYSDRSRYSTKPSSISEFLSRS